MSFDHLGFNALDFAGSRAFHAAALAPLGLGIAMEGQQWAAFGANGRPEFRIGSHGTVPARIHAAFRAADRAQVRAFHPAALPPGGTDRGTPGRRPQYHRDYYGAFVVDPDGHHIEAICRTPESFAASRAGRDAKPSLP